MQLYDETCHLYSKCDYVVIDGCDDCTVSVCTENCPAGTPPYYVRFDGMGQDCLSGNWISTISTSGCKSDDRQCAFDFCAEKCLGDRDCNEFLVSRDFEKCELYTDCNLDYHYEDDDIDGGFVGYFRQPPENRQDSSDNEDESSESQDKSDEGGVPETYGELSVSPLQLPDDAL